MMPDTPHTIDVLVDATLDDLDHDAIARDVLLERRLLAEHEQRIASPTSTLNPARRRGNRRTTGIGAALVGAAVVTLFVALSPGGSPTDRTQLPAPDSAQAALLHAGDSAAKSAWTPLGPNNYFHMYTTTFTPTLPDRGDHPNGAGSMFLGGVHAGESWIGRDGTGRTISITGGAGDPDRYPSFQRDPRTGKVRSIGRYNPRPGTIINVANALRYPDTVNVMSWPRDGAPPSQRAWVRTRTGYLKTDDFVMNERTMGRAQTPKSTIRQSWGATLEEIDAANDNPDPNAAARALINQHLDGPSDGFRSAKSGRTTIGGETQVGVTVSSGPTVTA